MPGKRRGRTSIIAASQGGRLVAPLTFADTCTTEVVDAYFARVLLPALPRGSVIVPDNARFHPSPTAAQLAAAAGCELMFLPPCSPDHNPIEHLWAALKARLRPGLPAPALCLPMLLLIAILAIQSKTNPIQHPNGDIKGPGFEP